VSIVPLTDHRVGKRIDDPGPPRAGSFVKIPWILFKHGRQNGPADECAYGRVCIGGGVALGIALRALPIAAESVNCLLNSRNGAGHAKVDRIDGGLPRQLELLFRVERSRGGVIGDVEIGNHPEDALLLFILDLGFGYLDRRHRDLHLGRGSRNVQQDRRHRVVLAGMQSSRSGLRSKPGRTDRELEGPRGDAGKAELPVAVRHRFLAQR